MSRRTNSGWIRWFAGAVIAVVLLAGGLTLRPDRAAAATFNGETYTEEVRPGDVLQFSLTVSEANILTDGRAQCDVIQPGGEIVWIYDAIWSSTISPPPRPHFEVGGTLQESSAPFAFSVVVGDGATEGFVWFVDATVIMGCGGLRPFSANYHFGPFTWTSTTTTTAASTTTTTTEPTTTTTTDPTTTTTAPTTTTTAPTTSSTTTASTTSATAATTTSSTAARTTSTAVSSVTSGPLVIPDSLPVTGAGAWAAQLVAVAILLIAAGAGGLIIATRRRAA